MDATKFDNIISRIRDNDTSALHELYENYATLISSIAYHFLKDYYLAEDVINEILIKIWNSAHKIKSIKNPTGWLYCVVKNFCLNHINKNKRYTPLNKTEPKSNPIDIAEANIQFQQLISPLKEVEQRVLILKIAVGYTFKEISKVLKINENATAKIYYRSIEKLKKLYK